MRRLLRKEILIPSSLSLLAATLLLRTGAAALPQESATHEPAPVPIRASSSARVQVHPVAREQPPRGEPAARAVTAPPMTEAAIASMSTLRRPQTDEDRDVERAAEREIALLTDPDGAPPEFWPGNPVEGSFRHLASGLGASGADLYAFATDRGRVCGGLLGAAVGCIEGFFEGDGAVHWTIGSSDDGATVVFGFAPDRVRAVAVLHGDGQTEATLTDNGFFVEIPGVERSGIDWLVISFADGHAERVEL